MLAAIVSVLQAADNVVLGAGVLTLLGWLISRPRGRRWHDPLADVPPPGSGPQLADAALAGLLFLMMPGLFAALFTTHVNPDGLVHPGSTAWHLSRAGADLGQVLLCAGMIWWLCRQPASARTALRPGSAIGVAVAALLIVLPLMTAQLQMGLAAWQLVEPSVAAPQHPALVALRTSEWGAWGWMQLAFGAIVLASVSEELVFRGFLLGALYASTGRPWLAVAGSAVIFGSIHGQPQDILPVMTLGVALGYVRLRSGALWPCVLMHVLFNARTMTFALLAAAES